jgi:hypothetical protein
MCEQQRQKEIAASPHSPSVLRLGATNLLSPYRTPNPAVLGCNSELAQYSNTPAHHHSAWPDSRTACPTKLVVLSLHPPKSRPRKRGTLQKSASEVGRTKRLVSTLQPATRVQFREGASNWVDTPFLQATTVEHERQMPNAKRRALNATV